jgi:sugar phosphate isomerase/epimerase
MNTGISTASLYLRNSTEEAISTIKSLGAQTCEVFLSTFYEYRPEFAKVAVKNLNGLSVNSVHTMSTNFEPMLFNLNHRVQGDGYYWCDQVLRSAQILGAKYYTMHGFFRTGGNKSSDNFDSMAKQFDKALEFFSRYGVQLCLENVEWCIYNRPGVFGELKKRCPTLQGVFDIKQARRSGYPWQMYLADMAGSIAYVHLSDIDENGKMCLPGKGIYDFTEIFKRLKDTGFDGSALIESYRWDYTEVEELGQSLDFLNEILYKLK